MDLTDRIRVRIRNTVLHSVELLRFLCYPKPLFLDTLRSPISVFNMQMRRESNLGRIGL
jgi:hypothetical protein